MRGSIRLAALMHLPSIFVFTHDSIGLGRGRPDAPADRAARGAAGDAGAEGGQAGGRERDRARPGSYAIKSEDHPTALVLSRQGIPTWDPSAIPADAIDRGAYVLRYSSNEPDPPDLILIATGTEVHICAERRGHARGRGDRDPGGEHAVHGELRRPGRRLP